MKPWAVFAVGVGLLTGVELAMPGGSARDLVYLTVAVAAVVAVLIGVRLHRPRERTGWYLLAAGIGSWAVGDLLWWWFDHVVGIDPFPSAADVAYLAGYPLFVLAVWRMSADHRRVVGRSSILDPLIAASCFGLVLWVVFIEPTWTAAEGDLVTRLVGVAYPLGDAALLTLLLHLAATSTGRTLTLRLLTTGFVGVLVADTLFQASAYVPALDEHVLWLDLPWLVAYVVWGTAALHPTMADHGHPRSVTGSLTLGRVALLAVAVCILPGTILVESALGLPTHTTAVSFAAVALIGLVMMRMFDVVRHLHEQARRLEVIAATDPRSGLENRRRLAQRLDERIDDDEPVTLLVVGVDRLREINDTLGERAGTELVRAIADRLVEATAPDGVVARIDAEAFGVLLPAAADEATCRRAHVVRDLLAAQFALSEVTLTVDVAVGVAGAPDDAATSDELLDRAVVALAAAREHPERVARYAGDMDRDGATASRLMSELVRAIEHEELVLHYQPQVSLSTGRVLGVEALVRWQHPELGLLPPVAFVPAAERTGLIRLLTLHVLDRSVAQAAAWRAAGSDLTVSVNLSARDLLDPHFVEQVRACLERHAVPASMLELELTETMAMLDPTRAVQVLGELDRLGITVSVDDYGTGYSSLAYLQRLPLRRLKIDRSFVADLAQGGASTAIVRSTIELARHLGLDVVAEGVEDAPTLLALQELNCFAAQGYGIGRPVPAERVPDQVADIESRVPQVLAADVPSQRSGPREPAPVVTGGAEERS
ncbi:GGDEF domain-containing protein [Cellulomonas sp. APG4]|uniref:putative bifunctional diguanylate cyclase/phosphodiesterase n=1 Tax=Cellulomonas sp. APG4 TaxID=1538656 RepID=UPI00137981B7|nr:bifunctional diguanylate cyclase/phosphodiesterase [Cellulomonas sp. APG4]NCT89368.1 GGDEF domain-containing protein [Cellulomonas sp. APG4]